MKVGFIGAGKLGLTVGVASESKGHDVLVCDPDPRIVDAIISRRFPHDEDGAQELWAHSNIQLASVAELVEWADIIFVAVQTPHDPEYEGITPMPETRRDFDYTFLRDACDAVATEAQRRKTHVTLSVISTVLPGTMDREIRPLLNEFVTLVYNPSFIAMGTTIRDFLHPEFTLMGTDDDVVSIRAGERVETFYHSIHDAPVYWTGIREAELTKVAYNTALSLKLGFINAIGMLCDATGTDVDEVSNALSLAHRRLWNPDTYFRAGMGDGGSCFPPGELVMTETGPRPIESIVAGDRVLTMDGSLQEVIKTWERPYVGELVIVKASGLPSTKMTADHPVMAREDLRPRYANGRRRTDRFPRSEITEVSAGDLTDNHLLTWPLPLSTGRPLPPHATPEYIELAGWYLSEGSVEISSRRGRLSWSLHAKETAEGDRIAELALICAPPRSSGRGENARVTITIDHNKRTVRFGSKGLAELLVQDFGKGAAEKSIPAWALWAEEKESALLLRGMLLGDGHFNNSGIAYATVSPHLAWGAFTLMSRLGTHPTLREIDARTGADGTRHRRAYEVRVRNRREARQLAEQVGLATDPVGHHDVRNDGWRPIVRTERTYYEGPVHNLWVAGSNTYVVRCGVVHNCHPRDNIALSWLAQQHGLPLDIFGELIQGREIHTKWLASKIVAEYNKTGLPVVVLGRAYKPNTRLTTGSAALLLAHYLTEADVKFDHLDVDEEYEGGPAIFFIATNHAQYATLQVPEGSVVIDPWGSVAHQAGIRYVSPGRP